MNRLNLPEFRALKVEENEQKDLKFTVEAIKRYDAGGHYYFRPKDNFEIN